jgi:hypothetical protein
MSDKDFLGEDINKVVDSLNDMLRNDPKTINKIVKECWPISETTAKEDPYIQCGKNEKYKSGYSVKFVGLLNGIFKCDEKMIAVELSYPETVNPSTEARMRSYQKGNFEVEKFRVVDKSEVT